MCPFWNVSLLELALFIMCSFRNVTRQNMLFLECDETKFGKCMIWNLMKLKCDLFGMGSFWNMVFLECKGDKMRSKLI